MGFGKVNTRRLTQEERDERALDRMEKERGSRCEDICLMAKRVGGEDWSGLHSALKEGVDAPLFESPVI